MEVRTVTQYSVFMANRPGALSGLVQLFADKGINLVGIASEVRDDSGVVRVAVEGDVDGADVLISAGFPLVETPLLSVELPDRPGALLDVTRALARAGVNITTVYGTATGGRSCRILLAVSDTEKAKQVFERFAVAG